MKKCLEGIDLKKSFWAKTAQWPRVSLFRCNEYTKCCCDIFILLDFFNQNCKLFLFNVPQRIKLAQILAGPQDQRQSKTNGDFLKTHFMYVFRLSDSSKCQTSQYPHCTASPGTKFNVARFELQSLHSSVYSEMLQTTF